MDFIDRILGLSPDGGDGSAELMILGVFVLMAVFVAWWLFHRPSAEDR